MKVGDAVLYDVLFIAAAKIRGNTEVLAKVDGRRSVPPIGVDAIPQAVDISSMQELIASENLNFGIVLRNQWEREKARENGRDQEF